MQLKKILTTNKLKIIKNTHINCYLFSEFNALRISKEGGSHEFHVATPINEKEIIKNLESCNLM